MLRRKGCLTWIKVLHAAFEDPCNAQSSRTVVGKTQDRFDRVIVVGCATAAFARDLAAANRPRLPLRVPESSEAQLHFFRSTGPWRAPVESAQCPH
jgi:hypothetical protein